MCLPMRAAAIFQLSGPRDLIGTNRYATTVPMVVATVKQKRMEIRRLQSQKYDQVSEIEHL